jgi:MFS family permease
MSPCPPPGQPPRGLLKLLLDPVVGPFFLGKLLSVLGIWIHNVAAAVIVFELTGSALWVGAVSVAQFGPQLLLTPWTGASADRGNRRRQIVIGRLIAAVSAGALVVWCLVVGLSGVRGAAAIIVVAFVIGVGFAIGGPAMQAILPSMVRRDELSAVVALNSLPMTIARAGGPAVGAVLASGAGPVVAFSVVAGTQILFAVLLMTIRIREARRPAAGNDSLRGGWRVARGDRAIMAALLGTTAVGFGVDPVITLTPAIAVRLGMESAFAGTLASSFGVGAGIALLVVNRCVRRWGLARIGSGGLIVLVVGLVGLAASGLPAVAAGALVVAGAGMTSALTAMTTVLHERSPEDVRGRIMALWSIAFIGTRPVAAAVNGAVADTFSVTVALVGTVVLVLSGAWLSRPSALACPARL